MKSLALLHEMQRYKQLNIGYKKNTCATISFTGYLLSMNKTKQVGLLFLISTCLLVRAYGQTPAPAAGGDTKKSVYTDEDMVKEFQGFGASPTQAQLDRLSNNLKANGIDFDWTGQEVLKLEQDPNTPITSAQANSLQKVLSQAGFVQNPSSNSTWNVLIWAGATLENPYSITNGTLKPNNSTTTGFIQLELTHRYVVSGAADTKDELYWSFPVQERRHDGEGTYCWFIPVLQLFPDLDFRVGYLFNGSSSPSNLTVSTIAGGSDVWSDNTVGFPFWRWSDKGHNWKQQATLELGGGFVTDKQFLAIHPNDFIGVGYQFHNTDWTWQTRFGMGGADIPRLLTGNNVATNSTGLPLFSLRQAPAWGTIITYNLSTAVKLQLGANAYFLPHQATWNLSAGISVDPAVAFKSLNPSK
jgi:hypothetical protein